MVGYAPDCTIPNDDVLELKIKEGVISRLVRNMNIEVTRKLFKAADLLRRKEFQEALSLVKEVQKYPLSASADATLKKILEVAKKEADSHIFKAEIRDEQEKGAQEAPVQRSEKLFEGGAVTALGYCILLMEHEKEVTIATLSNLLQQTDANDKIFLLFNGFSDYPLRVHMEKHAGVKCFESAANLGVAGGRNFLYSRLLEEAPGVTHIVTLDNDVLLPNDLNKRIKKSIAELYLNQNIGVMGAVILDYKVPQTRDYVEKNFIKFKGYLSADCYNVFSDDISDYIEKNKQNLKKILWHIGMHEDYKSVYIERTDAFASKGKQSFQPFLAHSAGAQELLKKKCFFVSNVPGCFQVFSVDHLKEVGPLEDRFSPYFFEDSEFCIRAIVAGKRNIICTDLLLFHGTDSRHFERKQEDKKYLHIANEYRARYILFRKLGVEYPLQKLIGQAEQIFGINGAGADRREKEFCAALDGLQKGVAQYTDDLADKNFKAIEKERKKLNSKAALILFGRAEEESKVVFDPHLPGKDEALPRVYFSKLKKFRNIYRGRDCLIICNGPSLKKTNLGLFAGMPTFSVNSIFILQETLGFTPTFYTVEDNHVVADNIEQIRALKAGVKFFPEKYRNLLGDQPNQYYLPTNWDCYFKSKISYEYPEFSTDIARTVYTGQTVTYLNLQLAYYFGFQRVFIVGLDFSYSIPKGARVDHNSIDHEDDDPNHFHPNYFGKGKQWHFPKLDSCLVSYSIAREAFEKAGRSIIDLTVESKLNVFERMEIEEALDVSYPRLKLGNGLEPRQYLADAAVRTAVAFGLRQPLVGSEFVELPNLGKSDVVIAAYSRVEDLMASLDVEMNAKTNSGVVLCYLEEMLVVKSISLNFIAALPFCSWVNTTLNNYYIDFSETGSLTQDAPRGVPFFLSKRNIEQRSQLFRAETLSKFKTILITDAGIFCSPRNSRGS